MKANGWHPADLLLEAIFPTALYCICCGAIIDSTRTYGLCDSCVEKVRWAIGKTCAHCGKLILGPYPHKECYDCRKKDHRFDHGYTCAQYGTLERQIIMEFKYCKKAWIGRRIAEAMADRMEQIRQNGGLFQNGEQTDDYPWNYVIPVPVHPSRLRERGYNHAAVIARFFARRTGLRFREDLLVRSRRTTAMKKLSSWERLENLAGAFDVTSAGRRALPGKAVLLIDDIYTTGSTADACTDVLKQAGAAQVDLLTFASGGNYPFGEDHDFRP